MLATRILPKGLSQLSPWQRIAFLLFPHENALVFYPLLGINKESFRSPIVIENQL